MTMSMSQIDAKDNYNKLGCCCYFQRARLLDNSERLERVGKKMDAGYRTCIETGEL